MTVERAVHRLTAEVAEWFGLEAGTLREGDRADFVVIDPDGLDDSVDAYHEEKVPFYGDLSRMVNRNDAAVVATGVNGAVVFREGEFRDGYGKTVKSGRFLKVAPAGHDGNACPPEMARTQQQRREETIARLLDASIDTIIDVGYAGLGGRNHQTRTGIRRRTLPALPDHARPHGRDAQRGGRRQLGDGDEAVRGSPDRQAGLRGDADDHQ